MAVKSEKIEGKIILCEFDSTNLKSAKYNTEDESLLVTFLTESILTPKFPKSTNTKN